MAATAQETVDANSPHTAAGLLSPAFAIFGLAFLVRAIFLLQSLSSPYFGAPFLDEQYFYEWALRISHGQLLSPHAFFRAPLYGYLLGGLFALAGPNFFLPKLLQHLLGSAAAVLIFKCAEKCFDRRAAWMAGILAALYPPLVFFEGELLDISLQCFFYPALVLLGCLSLRDPRRRWTVLFGVAAGAAAVARPNVLLLVGCWLLLQLLFCRRWGGRLAALGRAAAILGLVAAWTVPTLVHNVVADGSWVPVSTYAGINFWIGSRPTADGYTASTPRRYEYFGDYQDSVELFARRRAEELARRPLNGAQIQRFWTHQAWLEIGASPRRSLALLARKFVLFWNGYEIRNNKDLYFALHFTPVLDAIHRVWNFRVLAPLGLLGILLAAMRRRSAENLWLGLAVAAHMASVVLFFVCDRYRLPVAPLLIIFAAGGLSIVWQWTRERAVMKVALATILLIVLAALANVRWFDTAPAVPHKDLWNVANCLKAKGQLEEAVAWYRRFLDENPEFAEGWNNLGEVYVRRRRYDAALPCFQRAAELDKRLSLPFNNLGFCQLKLNAPSSALAAYDEALRRAPDSVLAANGRAEALAALGRDSEAFAELDWILAADPDCALALWTKASLLARRGESGRAREILEHALELASPALATEIRSDPALAPFFPPPGASK